MDWAMYRAISTGPSDLALGILSLRLLSTFLAQDSGELDRVSS